MPRDLYLSDTEKLEDLAHVARCTVRDCPNCRGFGRVWSLHGPQGTGEYDCGFCTPLRVILEHQGLLKDRGI